MCGRSAGKPSGEVHGWGFSHLIVGPPGPKFNKYLVLSKIFKEKVLNIAHELLKIARNSLVERGFLDSLGNNESGYLSVLEEILHKKASPARELIYSFANKYNSSIQKLVKDIAY